MGFFSSLLGGSKQSSKSTSSSGYSALSPALKEAFDPFGQQINQYTLPSNPGVNSMFTPLPQTQDETSAFSMMRTGFAPTQQSLTADINMQMNPYQNFVIDEINRQANGDFSILKQSLSNAGQMGSNREMLGANDIDLSRTNQIGGFLSGQFNNSLQNALGPIAGLRQQDATNMMGIGDFMRNLQMLTNQAPISALQAGTSLMAPFLSGGTDVSSSSGKSNKGLADMIQFSDPRLKENIMLVGQENGHKVYEFNYRGENQKFIGVMADEVRETHPEAVHEVRGYLAVNYDMIGVNFREAV